MLPLKVVEKLNKIKMAASIMCLMVIMNVRLLIEIMFLMIIEKIGSFVVMEGGAMLRYQ